MLLLQAQSPAYMQIILFGGIFVVFYFFMIRPQQQKAKEAKKLAKAKLLATLIAKEKPVTPVAVPAKPKAVTKPKSKPATSRAKK